MKNYIFKSNEIYEDMDSVKSKISKNIGNKIKKLRVQYQISGAELAKFIGISQQQLSRYENGLSDMSASKIILVSIYFNVDVEFFFKKIDDLN